MKNTGGTKYIKTISVYRALVGVYILAVYSCVPGALLTYTGEFYTSNLAE